MRKMMKTVMKVMMAGAMLASVTACTIAPPADALASADYGPYPANYLDVIAAYHEGALKDPSSAQVKVITEPRKSWTVANYKTVYGYRACLMVNAKNSFGGYTGATLTSVFIRDGHVVRYDQANYATTASPEDQCKRLAVGDTQ
jgi:hypothetical protein